MEHANHCGVVLPIGWFQSWFLKNKKIKILGCWESKINSVFNCSKFHFGLQPLLFFSRKFCFFRISKKLSLKSTNIRSLYQIEAITLLPLARPKQTTITFKFILMVNLGLRFGQNFKSNLTTELKLKGKIHFIKWFHDVSEEISILDKFYLT